MSVIYENDQLLTDRNYTFGILGTKTCSSDGEEEQHQWNFLHNWNTDWLEVIQNYVPISATQYRANSIHAGISLYTPNSLDIETPTKKGGRPYASLVMFGDSIVQVEPKKKKKAVKQGMQLGILGLPVGGEIQTAVHKIVDSPQPKGWSSEISRGGEPTLLYAIQGKNLWHDHDISAFGVGQKLELTTNKGLTVGYYSSLQAGISIRLGKISSPFWSDYGPIHNHIVRPAITKVGKSKELYGFLGAGVELVMYNALLQGQFRRNDYEIEASDVERAIPHITAGGVVHFERWQFSISHNYRGPEIRGGKDHRWTSFSVRYFY